MPLLITMFTMMLGIGFYMTFASLRVSMEGNSRLMIGVIASAYYLGMMIGSLYIEQLIERIGYIRAFTLYAGINIAAVVLQSWLSEPAWWIVLRFLIGMSCAAYFIVIESWLLLASTPQTRGKALSLYMLIVYSGQGVGQFILNGVSVEGHNPFLVTILLAAIAIIPIMLMKTSSPAHVETSPLKLLYLAKKVPLGAIGTFLAGMIISSFYGLAPIFATDLNFTKPQISTMMGLTIIGGLLLQWPLGHLSDIIDRPKVIVGTCIALIINCMALFFFQKLPYEYILLLMVAFGGISFTLYPLSISHTCDHFSPYLIVKITCSLLIVYGVGCVLGPVIAAWIMNLTSPGGLFLYSAILSLLIALLGITRIFSGKTVPRDEQGDYMPLPRTTSLVNYLYPRGKGIELEMDNDEDDEE